MALSHMLRTAALALSLLLPFAGAAAQAEPSEPPPATRTLPLPQPPKGVEGLARPAYMARHYWDGFDFRDREWLRDTASLEQAFATWAYILDFLPDDTAAPEARRLVDAAAAADNDMLLRLADIAELYFDDPNSPYRREALFIPVLEGVVAAPKLSADFKIRPRAQLEDARKNRPGMPAAPLAGETADGRSVRLADIRGEWTLLLFYEPGCPDCARVERHIDTSPVLRPLIRDGRLAVVACYADSDLAAWRRHLPELPATWTVLCDPRQELRRKRTYVIRATPTLYLLDHRKRVIWKDAPVERIEAWLKEQLQGKTDDHE